MIERHDHLELLALIEDELDAATAAQLRKRLASEPRVLEAVERIRRDRISLRAMGEIHVPTDVLDQLEALLARPMLAEPLEPLTAAAGGNGRAYAPPGQYRKQYHRQALRIRWRRIAVAAVLFMALIAGVWGAMNGLSNSPSPPADRMIASGESSSPPVRAVDVAVSEGLTGTIHHAQPNPSLLRATVASRSESRSITPPAPNNETQVIMADFAIVVHSASGAATGSSFTSFAGEMDKTVALVRNFSFAEATRIAEDLQLARGARREADQGRLVASANADQPQTQTQLKSLAELVRRHFNTHSQSVHSAQETSGQISGPRDIAPALELQLELSSRGATHSVAVPISQLKTFLERAAIRCDEPTSLRMFLEKGSIASARDEAINAWATQHAHIQKAFEELKDASPEAIVIIPVVIQSTE